MKEHNIVYNYGFLADWMKANPSIKRNEILSSMEMSDYNTLRNWVDGATMLPLTQLMKFCNRFNVRVNLKKCHQNRGVPQNAYSLKLKSI